MSTIPNFPNFAPVDLDHKPEITAFTSQFPSYSDFNFTSMYSWNTERDMAVSWLNDNLALECRDYISDKRMYSFIGNTALRETAAILLETAKTQSNTTPELHLIPEMTAKSLQTHGEFQVTEDPDHHDYLISTEQLVTLTGGPQAHTRELVNRFRRDHQTARFEQCSPEDPSILASLDAVFYKRENHRGSVNQKEFTAFKRSLQPSVSDSQQLFGVFIEDNLHAFISCERVDDNVSIAHFSKANTDYRGIYQYLIHSLAQTLHRQQVQTLNMEQDLGLPGLRASKQYLRPVGYLKKYVIQQKPAA